MTARSQASRISVPPPKTKPFTAAIRGLSTKCRTMPAKPRPGWPGSWTVRPAASSLRSAPAQKARPAPVVTPTRDSGSASSARAEPAAVERAALTAFVAWNRAGGAERCRLFRARWVSWLWWRAVRRFPGRAWGFDGDFVALAFDGAGVAADLAADVHPPFVVVRAEVGAGGGGVRQQGVPDGDHGPAGGDLGAALPVVAPGLQERTRMTRGEEFEEPRPLLFSDRRPDPGQRGRDRGRGPGDLAALRGLPGTTRLGPGLPVRRGDPDLDRRAALGPRPAGGARRAVVP
jgi:hypothetical protein